MRCSSSGNVHGVNIWTGGLVGNNNNGGLIKDSYSNTEVSSSARIFGSLVGLNADGLVDHSYATGNVYGAPTADGHQSNFVGYLNGGKVENSFAVGSIGNSHLTPVAGTIGFMIGFFLGGAVSNLHYDAGATCTPSGSCGAVGTPHVLSHFYSSASAPLSVWDFNNVWIERVGALPELR